MYGRYNKWQHFGNRKSVSKIKYANEVKNRQFSNKT